MMAKSMRRASARPTTPALHAILLDPKATRADIRAYFDFKKEHGSRAVPKPIVSGSVIRTLNRLLQGGPNDKVRVQIVVICLEEFLTNVEVERPWSEFYKEVSQLLHSCLSFHDTARGNDSVNKTSNFKDSFNIFSKFCHLLTAVADKSKDLSTALLEKCADTMLCFMMLKDVTPILQQVILLALSTLCHNADANSVPTILSRSSLYIKYVARKIMTYPVETQMHLYILLTKSLTSNKEAAERAPSWFPKWPALQEAFVEFSAKDFSEGCGKFLNEVFRLSKLPTNLNPPQVLGQGKTAPEPSTVTKTKSSSQNVNQGSTSKNQVTTTQAGKTPKHLDLPQEKTQILTANEEDLSSKVGRWLNGLSAEQTKVQAEDADLQMLKPSISQSIKHNDGKSCFVDYERNVFAKKRSALAETVPPKRRKEESEDLVCITDGDLARRHSSAIGSEVPYVSLDFLKGRRNGQNEPNPKSGLKVPVKTDDEVFILFEGDTFKAKEETKGKRKLYSHDTTVDTFSSKENMKEKAPPLRDSSSNAMPVKHWAQKLRALEDVKEKEGSSNDVYCFHMTQPSNDQFKIPTMGRKPASRKSASSKLHLKQNVANKENIRPKKASKNPTYQGTSIFSKTNNEVLKEKRALVKELSNSSCSKLSSTRTITSVKPKDTAWDIPKVSSKLQEHEVKGECYSPRLDDSMEFTKPERIGQNSVKQETKAGIPRMEPPNMKTTSCKPPCLQDTKPEMSNAVGSCNAREKVGALSAGSVTMSKPGVESRGGKLDHCHINEAGKIATSGVKPVQMSETLKSVSCKEGDSGFEVTSASDVLSSSSKEEIKCFAPGKSKTGDRSSKRHLYLQLRVRDYLKRAKDLNSDMLENQNVVSSEILQIQGLAEKICQSASRCQTASSANQQKLGVQSTALEKCTNYLGPNEDQGFIAHVPSTKPLTLKEFASKIRANHKKRVREVLESVLNMDDPLSSDSD